jgi:hypothetical protein
MKECDTASSYRAWFYVSGRNRWKSSHLGETVWFAKRQRTDRRGLRATAFRRARLSPVSSGLLRVREPWPRCTRQSGHRVHCRSGYNRAVPLLALLELVAKTQPGETCHLHTLLSRVVFWIRIMKEHIEFMIHQRFNHFRVICVCNSID